MPASFDFKKEYKDLYLPKTEPQRIVVPEMDFITVAGRGDPNDESGDYKKALEILYALSYAIKMSKMGQNKIDGYFEYVVAPLEGFWWTDGSFEQFDINDKANFYFISAIRQPVFVTDGIFEWAREEALRKKGIDASGAKFEKIDEGLCVQCMHIGPYDDEKRTLEKIDVYIEENGLSKDLSKTRLHHEIYFGDPRKIDPSKLKTVIRIPVK